MRSDGKLFPMGCTMGFLVWVLLLLLVVVVVTGAGFGYLTRSHQCSGKDNKAKYHSVQVKDHTPTKSGYFTGILQNHFLSAKSLV